MPSVARTTRRWDRRRRTNRADAGARAPRQREPPRHRRRRADPVDACEIDFLVLVVGRPPAHGSVGVRQRDPPADAPRDPQKEKQLQGLVENAAGRGWEILFFGPGHYGRPRSFEQDPFGALSLAAGIEDTMRAFPQAKGVVIDGAFDWEDEPLLRVRCGERSNL